MNQLPERFVKRLKSERPEVAPHVLEAIEAGKPGTSIRLNPAKRFTLPSSVTPIPWAQDGYYLAERGSFITDPLWHAGAYYVQEASSMLIELALKQHGPSTPCKALDLCAAPGGKTTHLASLLPDDSMIIANEVIKSRANILSANVKQWGNPDVFVTNNDPEDFADLGGFFDVVLVDAPCSGEGMFRKDIRAAAEWTESNVSLCASRQKRILMDAWEALAPGGLLLYSTCTFNRLENEENMDFLHHNTGCEWLPLSPEDHYGVSQINARSGMGYACYPGITRGEGFFLAVARKPEDAPFKPLKSKGKKHKKTTLGATELLKPYIRKAELFYMEESSMQTLVKKHFKTDIEKIKSRLNFKRLGVFAGEQKGKNFIPSHELATSSLLNKETFIQTEVSLEEAFFILSRNTITLNSSQRGIHLVTFQAIPVAFMKHLGNRSNNLFPAGLRILKQFDADKLWSLAKV